MTEKSKFRENLEELTEDQFSQVERDFASAKAARGNNDDYRRKVADMTDAELAREKNYR